MLKYKLGARLALAKLFAYRNDVDIYTEDNTVDKEFYKSILSRICGDFAKINDITPLGCKTNVLKAYDNRHQTTRRTLFIVDGDLDLLLNTNRRNERNLLVLDSYCIENYLIEESGLVEVLYYNRNSDTRESLSAELNYNQWLDFNGKILCELFFNYAILRKVGGAPVIQNLQSFIKKSKDLEIDIDKITVYINSVKKDINLLLNARGEQNPVECYTAYYKALEKQWPPNLNTYLRVISGKNFLLPLSVFRVNQLSPSKNRAIPPKAYKLFLANNIDLTRLDFIKNHIAKL